MKKVVIIPDSFKGTMSSEEICDLASNAIRKTYPDCNCITFPVADGGEGTVDAFRCNKVYVDVTGPWNESVKAFYGVLGDNAVVEVAAAAGLPMVGDKKSAMDTTTYGVGMLMCAAYNAGFRKISVGLGGSCTNDMGCGAAAACGIKFFDRNGKEFIPVGRTICDISKIDTSGYRLKGAEVTAMCDVNTPFVKSAEVFGPQKGASVEEIRILEGYLNAIIPVIKRDTGIDVSSIPGAGAAGSMGGGIAAFFNGKLKMGIEVVLDVLGFENAVKDADLVLTGEGKIDFQSIKGKVVVGVARRAKKYNVPVVAIVGDIGDPIDEVYSEGVSGVFSINRIAAPYKELRPRAKDDLYRTVDNLMRFLNSFGN